MKDGLTYAAEQRLRLIDFLLHYYGCVGRKEIMNYFGVEAATVTRDFAAYRALSPGNILINQTTKRYVRSESFTRVWK